MIDAAGMSEAIRARREDLVSLTRELVQVPTLNPPGNNYRDLRDDRGAVGRLGFATEYVRAEGTPGDSDRYPRWNLVARREGGRPGPCVHFNGHTDVVEVGQGWTTDPFGGEVIDGRIYGRGTCDMKGGIAAAIVAVEAFLALRPGLSRRDRDLRHRRRGDRRLRRRRAPGAARVLLAGRVDHVIIPEPLNKDRVCLGHRGVWWAELETYGRIAHGSMPFLGDCAVRHMGAVIAEMEASLFPALAARRTAMPVVPEAARASTLNINSLHGGQAEPEAGFTGWPSPVVPDRCRMVIDRRFLVEEEIGAVKAEFRATVERARERRGFRLRYPDMHEVLPVMIEPDAPVAAALARAIERVLGSQRGVRRLAGHLRPEAHRPDRPAQELRGLRARHTGPRAPTRRICRRRGHARRRHGDGAGAGRSAGRGHEVGRPQSVRDGGGLG